MMVSASSCGPQKTRRGSENHPNFLHFLQILTDLPQDQLLLCLGSSDVAMISLAEIRPFGGRAAIPSQRHVRPAFSSPSPSRADAPFLTFPSLLSISLIDADKS